MVGDDGWQDRHRPKAAMGGSNLGHTISGRRRVQKDTAAAIDLQINKARRKKPRKMDRCNRVCGHLCHATVCDAHRDISHDILTIEQKIRLEPTVHHALPPAQF